jgi:hypothetical protein
MAEKALPLNALPSFSSILIARIEWHRGWISLFINEAAVFVLLKPEVPTPIRVLGLLFSLASHPQPVFMVYGRRIVRNRLAGLTLSLLLSFG